MQMQLSDAAHLVHVKGATKAAVKVLKLRAQSDVHVGCVACDSSMPAFKPCAIHRIERADGCAAFDCECACAQFNLDAGPAPLDARGWWHGKDVCFRGPS